MKAGAALACPACPYSCHWWGTGYGPSKPQRTPGLPRASLLLMLNGSLGLPVHRWASPNPTLVVVSSMSSSMLTPLRPPEANHVTNVGTTPRAWQAPPPPTSPKPTREEAAWLRNATFLRLAASPVSPGAHALVDDLAHRLMSHEAATRGNKRREAGLSKLKAAVGVVAGGVLRPWGLRQRPAYRTMGLKELAGPVVGARSARSALDALESLGFLRRADGRRRNLRFDDGKPVSNGLAPRFWPSPTLLALASGHGVTPETIKADFKLIVPDKAPDVPKRIELRHMPPPGQKKARATPKPFDLGRDATASALDAHVAAMNEFASGFTVAGCEPPRWRRIFTETWGLGGRWYAAGGDAPYQTMGKDERLMSLGIDGKAVIEVDVRGSHLTIMHGLLGLPLPPGDDLYAPLGFPRDVVKAWVTGTLGKGSPVSKWSKKHLEDNPSLGEHGAAAVGAAVLARYPFLKAPGEAVADAGGLRALGGVASPAKMLTHRLMAIEAAALTAAMDALRAEGILALPMHDALIVRESHAGIAKAALTAAFEAHAGIAPRLKTEVSWL